MKLAKVSVGLLINFNVELLKEGIRRFVLYYLRGLRALRGFNSLPTQALSRQDKPRSSGNEMFIEI